MTQGTETAPAALPSPKERRRLREAKSLTQEQVAAALGVSRETIKAWESGRINPKRRKRAAYAKLLASFKDEPPAEGEPKPPSEGTVAGGDVQGRSPQGVEHNHPEQSDLPERSTPEETPQRGTDPNASEKAPHRAPAIGTDPAKDAHRAPEEGTDPNATAPTAPADRTNPIPTAPTAPADRTDPNATAPTAPADRTNPIPTAPTAPADRTDPIAAALTAPAQTPAQAFDALYAHSAHALLSQAYLLTGNRPLARESVEYAFRLAWERWPAVATDRDPASWVRAAAYEYALSPWHRLRGAHKRPERPPADRDRRVLLQALLALPPVHRRTLLLYDGLGLDLPDTAAETEASTPATANRLLNARAAIAKRLPELADAGAPAEQSALLRERLGHLAEIATAPPVKLPPARAVRTGSERRTRFWTRAAIFFTTMIVSATGFTLVTAPTRYEPPQSPGVPVRGVPVRGGPPPLTLQDEELRGMLHDAPVTGPPRLVPETR